MGSLTRNPRQQEIVELAWIRQRREFAARRALAAAGHDPEDLVSSDGTTVLQNWMERVRNEVA